MFMLLSLLVITLHRQAKDSISSETLARVAPSGECLRVNAGWFIPFVDKRAGKTV